MEKETVYVMFLHEFKNLDRKRHILRKNIPHLVYFLKNKGHLTIEVDESKEFIHNLKKELSKELPQWVSKRSLEVDIDYYDFEDCFLKILEIAIREKKKGNEVIGILHSGSTIAKFGMVTAFALAGCKILWVMPKKRVGDKIHTLPVGAKTIMELNLPFVPELPKDSEGYVLAYVAKNKGIIKGKLITLAKKIGLDKLGANVKKETSGAVKLSKILSKLRESKLVETKKVGRKNFEIRLTHRGKLFGDVLNILD